MIATSNLFALVKREIVAWTRLFVEASTLCTCLALLDAPYLLIDLFSHFRVQYLLAGSLGLLVFAATRQPRIGILSCLCVALNLPAVLPFISIPRANAAVKHGAHELRVATINVFTANSEFDSVIRKIQEMEPDILLLLEVDSRWASRLQELTSNFRYTEFHPREDNFGLAILSKFPFSNERDESLTPYDIPAINARIEVGDTSVRLIGIHALPPASSDAFHLRNQVMGRAAQIASEEELSVILMGDLNSTMWSSSFKSFLAQSGLVDLRVGRGIFPTWPNVLGFTAIPLDHILASKDLSVTALESVKVPGSDHFGMSARVLLNN